MGEDGRAIALDMLVEPDSGARLGQHARKRGLADLKRIALRKSSPFSSIRSKAYRNTLSFFP
jgi:hypothetical protein